jgi:hypothetical protein
MHPLVWPGWQVAIPNRGRRLAPRASTGGGAGGSGHDRGQIGWGEPQVFAEEGARDGSGGGLLAQPGLTYAEPLGGLGWRVQRRVVVGG